MIINAILKEVYGGKKTDAVKKKEYALPKNLEGLFDGLDGKKNI